MPDCLACLGEGQHDYRDEDAFISEHWTDAEIARARARGMGFPLGIVQCEECEGTGVISEERWRDMMAVARAFVDQAIARATEEGVL